MLGLTFHYLENENPMECLLTVFSKIDRNSAVKCGLKGKSND